MKKTLLAALLVAASVGCVPDQRNTNDLVLNYATNAAYAKGRSDVLSDIQMRDAAIRGVQNDIRVLLTNQISLNQRLEIVESHYKALFRTNSVAVTNSASKK